MPQSSELTKQDLWDVRDFLIKQQEVGFSGIHERLDRLNGRVRSAEVQIGRNDERIKALQESHREPAEKKEEEGNKRVTERDVRLVILGGSAVGGFIAMVYKALPALLKAIHP